MKSNNPVFSRSEEFNRASSNAYGNQTYAGGGQNYPGYGETTGEPTVDGGRMTVDSVIQKTAISVGLVFVTAIITWWYIGDFTGTDAEPRAASRALALAGARCRRRLHPVAGQLVQARDQPGPGDGVRGSPRASPSARSARCSRRSSTAS